MIRPGIKQLFRLRLWRGASVDRDLDEEIELHLELRARQLEAAGMPSAEARLEARRRFGTMPAARRALRSTAAHRETTMHVREWFDGWNQDLRYALRGLRNERLFTVFVIVTLALGIGANAAMFGVVDRLLLRGPDHVVDAGRVMRVYRTQQDSRFGPSTTDYLGYVTYAHLKKAGHDFAAVAASGEPGNGMLGRGADARQIQQAPATADYFSLLGVRAYRGRFFSAAEDTPGDARRVAVLGYGLWQRMFGGNGEAIGKTVILGGDPYVVVGVAPRGFTGTQLSPVDIWTPMSLRHPTPDWTTTWHAQWLQVFVRLKPGVTAEEATADATSTHRSTYAGTDSTIRNARLFVAPLSADAEGKTPTEAAVSKWLLGVALIVLLIACANVTNLQWARVVRRRQEVAVRLALGAGRARLLRLLATEGLLLACGGAIASVAVAAGLAWLIRNVLLPQVQWTSSPVDGRILAATFAVAALVGMVVGLVPAWRASRADLTSDLKSGARDGGGRSSRVRAGLTIAQAALSAMLLVGAGLFVLSVRRARDVDLGLQADRVLVAGIPGQGSRSANSLPTVASITAEQNRQHTVYRDLLRKLRALPGVANAAVDIGLPFNTYFGVSIRVPGWDSIPPLPGGGPYISAVSDGYFTTVGTRLLQGRVFTPADRDGSEPVAIVSQTMARTLWPDQSALGRCLITGDDSTSRCSRIVGVVADVHRSQISEPPAMQYYVPFGQETGIAGAYFLVRPVGPPSGIAEPVRRLLAAAVPEAPYIITHPLEDDIAPQYRPFNLGAAIFSLCALLALIVAAIGLYSVMSYLVAQRRHEFGVRLALGARGRDMLRLVLTSGLSVAVVGIALGLGAALVGAHWLQPLLFQTSARDPLVYVAVAVVLVSVAIVASLGPGLRAERIDPLDALRAE